MKAVIIYYLPLFFFLFEDDILNQSLRLIYRGIEFLYIKNKFLCTVIPYGCIPASHFCYHFLPDRINRREKETPVINQKSYVYMDTDFNRGLLEIKFSPFMFLSFP